MELERLPSDKPLADLVGAVISERRAPYVILSWEGDQYKVKQEILEVRPDGDDPLEKQMMDWIHWFEDYT